MKKKFVYLIIVISSFSLLGIFITQIYWVRESYDLKEELFSNTVRIAIKGVANQMLIVEQGRISRAKKTEVNDQVRLEPEVAAIDPGLLDFKMNEEMKCMQVGNAFRYALLDLDNRSILMGNDSLHKVELFSSPHQIPMTGFSDPERYSLSVYFPRQQSMILQRMIYWLVISVIFAVLLFLSFYYTIYIFIRQKQLSEMKSDFVNNMTHEFKTPIATISLASEMLMKDNILDDPMKSKRYARIIYDENNRLKQQVEQILNISILDRGDYKLKVKDIDLNDVVLKAADTFQLSVKEKEGVIMTYLYAKRPVIKADRIHITNVINNLIDNAVKYSEDHPQINISTKNVDNGIQLSVEDRGIGISPEDQKHIFKKLYRVSTGDIHNVKGFGIGLFYVKTIVEAHGGSINLWSELGKGSRFDVFLPYRFDSSKNYQLSDEETNDTSGRG